MGVFDLCVEDSTRRKQGRVEEGEGKGRETRTGIRFMEGGEGRSNEFRGPFRGGGKPG